MTNKFSVGDDTMLKGMMDLFTLISSKSKKSGTVDNKKFIYLVKKNNQEFNNEDHHDSHEFLMWLLDSINETIKSCNRQSRSMVETVSIII